MIPTTHKKDNTAVSTAPLQQETELTDQATKVLNTQQKIAPAEVIPLTQTIEALKLRIARQDAQIDADQHIIANLVETIKDLSEEILNLRRLKTSHNNGYKYHFQTGLGFS